MAAATGVNPHRWHVAMQHRCGKSLSLSSFFLFVFIKTCEPRVHERAELMSSGCQWHGAGAHMSESLGDSCRLGENLDLSYKKELKVIIIIKIKLLQPFWNLKAPYYVDSKIFIFHPNQCSWSKPCKDLLESRFYSLFTAVCNNAWFWLLLDALLHILYREWDKSKALIRSCQKERSTPSGRGLSLSEGRHESPLWHHKRCISRTICFGTVEQNTFKMFISHIWKPLSE